MYLSQKIVGVAKVFLVMEWVPSIEMVRVFRIKGTPGLSDIKDDLKLDFNTISEDSENFDSFSTKYSEEMEFEAFKMEIESSKDGVQKDLNHRICIGFMERADSSLDRENIDENGDPFKKEPLNSMMTDCNDAVKSESQSKSTQNSKNPTTKAATPVSNNKQLSNPLSVRNTENIDSLCRLYINDYLMDKIFSVVNSLHEKNFLHLDLKLDNFLVTKKEEDPPKKAVSEIKPKIGQTHVKTQVNSSANKYNQTSKTINLPETKKAQVVPKNVDPIIEALEKYKVLLNDFDMIYAMPDEENSLPQRESPTDAQKDLGTCNVFFFEKSRLETTLSALLQSNSFLVIDEQLKSSCSEAQTGFASDKYLVCKVIDLMNKAENTLKNLEKKYCKPLETKLGLI